MKTPTIFKFLMTVPLCLAPVKLMAQTPAPLFEYQFSEVSTSSTTANTGSLGGSATYTGTGVLGTQAGTSVLSGDYSFNNNAATAMGSAGAGTGTGVYTQASISSPMQSITIQGWFKSGSAIANGARLADNFNSSLGSGFSLRGPTSSETQGALYLIMDGQTVNSGSAAYSDTNSWVFFAATYNYVSSGTTSLNKVTFYKGTPSSTVVKVSESYFPTNIGQLNASTVNVTFGNMVGGIRPYDGNLDNLRIYGSTNSDAGALTLNQLETLRRSDLCNTKITAAVTVNATSVIRQDISADTFGGGIAHNNVAFRYIMTETGGATTWNTRNMIADLGLGWMRFPNGTCTQFYRWSYPPGSYLAGAPDGSWILTPDEIYSYTGTTSPGLSMNRLFQVNTYRYWLDNDFWTQRFINANGQNSPYVINTTNLDQAATSAAGWVTNNLGQTSDKRVTYWEVGNEDWVYWSPASYAQIFTAYAAKMKAANPNIKLLAQTLTDTFGTNTSAWTSDFAGALSATAKSMVQGLSDHEYLNGNANTGYRDFSDRSSSLDDQRFWQTQNMFAKVQRNDHINFLNSELLRLGLNWEVWVTEFNLYQTDKNGNQMIMQDLGHAMVIADYTGRMLQSGVKRMLMHSLDHDPGFALLNYLNNGGTYDAPIEMAPGYGFEIFPQEFGPVMVNNSVDNNPTLSSPNEGTYNQISVYSSLRTADNTLRLVAINRSSYNGARLTVQCPGKTLASGTYSMQELYSPNISDSNISNADHVKWSNTITKSMTGATVEGIVLKEHSVNIIVIPLAP